MKKIGVMVMMMIKIKIVVMIIAMVKTDQPICDDVAEDNYEEYDKYGDDDDGEN